jgi:hypothetical protein
MTLLEKIDLVLGWLYINSGTNPTFQDISKALKDKGIDLGEIQDCLLHLYRKKLIYCEFLGNRDSQYTDDQGAHYLISFKGKLFWETTGGFKERARLEQIKINSLEEQNRRMERNDEQLVTWTENLANRTRDLTNWTKVVGIGAVGLVVWEIIDRLFF